MCLIIIFSLTIRVILLTLISGTPVNKLDSMNIIHRAFSTFSPYKIFRMSDDKYRINKLQPLKTITAISNDKCKSLNEFKHSKILVCLNLYLSINKQI